MIKKKVLVHGSLNSLIDFFSSPFNREYEPLAVVTDEIEKVTVYSKQEVKPQLEIFETEKLNRILMRSVDGIVLTEVESRNKMIDYLLKIGIEARKFILWNNSGIIKPVAMKLQDGSVLYFMEGLQFHIRNEDDMKFFNEMRDILQNQRKFYTIHPRYYPGFVAQQYRQQMNKDKPLDWNNLRTWTEKMQWIKLYDSTPIKTRIADKYLVRQWVAEKIGQEYLMPLYGVWDKFDDIDFNILPNQFVLKCNHGSGMNIICRDKNKFDFEGAKQKLTAWLAMDYGTQGFQPHYSNIKRKIIAEKFMTDGDKPDLEGYKFWCFDGKPFYCGHETGRTADLRIDNLRIDYFDMDWNRTEIENGEHPRNENIEHFPKPKNFDLMKKLAAELCKDFAFVRVDFYEIDDKIYFGEMTFTPGATYVKWNSEGTDEHFGSLMTLPNNPNFAMHYAKPSDFELKYSVRRKISSVKNILPRKVQPPAKRVIASLTSWTKRISTVHLAIKTILAQTKQPNLTVLYLADSEFPNREKDLPRELTALVSKKFEIRWTKDIKSYKKLIPALKDFPDDAIVTFDDDIFYDRRLVEILFDEYVKNPQYIHCHIATTIQFNELGEILDATFSEAPCDKPSYLNRLTGVGSVLYPPHCLYEDVLKEEKFMSLAPSNDDLWFMMMGALNGYKVNCVRNNLEKLNYIPNTQTEGVALWTKNNFGDKLFFPQLKNILDAYPVLKDILENEWRRIN